MNKTTTATFLSLCEKYDYKVTESYIQEIEKRIHKPTFASLFELIEFLNEYKAFRIVSMGWHVTDVICNSRLDIDCFDQKKMSQNKWEMFRINKNSRNIVVEEFMLPLCITPSSWTCNCKQDFIRSTCKDYCHLCKTNIHDSKRRLPFIQDFINKRLNK